MRKIIPDVVRDQKLSLLPPTATVMDAVRFMAMKHVGAVLIGEALMRDFEGWARSRECRLVALATRRAAAFYRAIGYEESATYFRRLLQGARSE